HHGRIIPCRLIPATLNRRLMLARESPPARATFIASLRPAAALYGTVNSETHLFQASIWLVGAVRWIIELEGSKLSSQRPSGKRPRAWPISPGQSEPAGKGSLSFRRYPRSNKACLARV